MSLVTVRGRRPGVQRMPTMSGRRVERQHVRRPDLPDLRIDRVLLCPSGLFVVSRGDATPASTAHARRVAATLAAVLPPRYRRAVRPVLVRTDEEAIAETVEGILVTTEPTLEHISRSSPVVLSTSEIGVLERHLDHGLEPFPMTKEPVRRTRLQWLLAAAGLGMAGAGTAAGHAAYGVLPWPW